MTRLRIPVINLWNILYSEMSLQVLSISLINNMFRGIPQSKGELLG